MRVETVTWGRRKRDVPTGYTYLELPQVTPTHTPQGIECAEGCRHPHRDLTACNQCGHVTCPPGSPCDICRVTIRIRALEEPS
jgi:hypothetical protein